MKVLRRIPPESVQWKDSQPIPVSSNFEDKVNELSMYIAGETTPDKVLAGHEEFGLVELTLQQIRDAYKDRPLSICRDETDDSGPGHILVCGKPSLTIKRKIKECAKWVPGRWPKKLPEH